MFAGHLGAALALASVERRVNPGLFVAAALLLDVALWAFVLMGWESVLIGEDFAATHQPAYVFPYSHGLLASLAWSGLAAAAGLVAFGRLGPAKQRTAALLAGAVFSHWLLDALVHRPEMPWAGAGSAMLGLHLWQRMPLALAVEVAVVMLGLALFIRGSGLSRRKALALGALAVLVSAFTVLGMTLAPAPPSAQAMAASSLPTLLALCAGVAWLARPAAGGRG